MSRDERHHPARAPNESELEAQREPEGEEVEEPDELEPQEPSESELQDEASDLGLSQDAGEAEILEAEELDQEVGGGAALVRVEAKSLARYDPLQAYINQSRRYPLLTPEEEHELAVRYRETGDLDVARQLVTANLRLVVKLAHEYRKAHRNLLDLVQEGNVGLMHAVRKFDPYRGVRLSSYAAWWIRAYILRYVLNNWRMVKIGTTQAQRKLFFNLRKEKERLEAMGVERPGPKLLAERLEVGEDEVKSMQSRLAASDLSLDAPMRSDDAAAGSRLEFVAERSAGPDREVENREFSELLQSKIQPFGRTLPGRDREIFQLRTTAEDPLTLQEIGDRFGITRERARQIERRMMDRLRD